MSPHIPTSPTLTRHIRFQTPDKLADTRHQGLTRQLWFMVAREGWRILIPPRPTPPSKAQALVRMIEMYLKQILRWTLNILRCTWEYWDVPDATFWKGCHMNVWTWKAAPGSTFQFSSPAPPSQPRLRKPVPSNYKLVNSNFWRQLPSLWPSSWCHHNHDQIMNMVMITMTSLSSAVSLSTWSVSKSTRATSAGSPRSSRIWPWWWSGLQKQ